jgi:hypothetical protein
MSESAKRSLMRPELRKKYSDVQKKRYEDPEERRKQSERGKKKIFTEEHRKKLSESESGNKNHQFGKPPTYEAYTKSTETRIGGFWYGNIRYENIKYCELWTEEFRERVRAFFGYLCVECYTPQNGTKLHVHHINYDKKTCCKNKEEIGTRLFVPLCKSCHGKSCHNRNYWEQHFTDMINDYYGGKCYFTKEEMKVYLL